MKSVFAASAALVALSMTGSATAMSKVPERLEGVQCEIAAIESDGKTMLEARVRPGTAMAGSYAMKVGRTVGGMSTSSTTGGTWDADAGETVTLGRSSVGGTLDDVVAEMTVTVDGISMDCPLRTAPELTV